MPASRRAILALEETLDKCGISYERPPEVDKFLIGKPVQIFRIVEQYEFQLGLLLLQQKELPYTKNYLEVIRYFQNKISTPPQ